MIRSKMAATPTAPKMILAPIVLLPPLSPTMYPTKPPG